MALFVYRRRNSAGARDLVEEIMLLGTRARRTKGMQLRNLQNGDQVVCWGDYFTAPQGVRTLNNVQPISKFREAQILREKNVPTVQVSQTRPAVRAAASRPAFVDQFTTVNAVARVGVADAEAIANSLLRFVQQERERRRQYDAQPAPAPVPQETWLPRRNNHVGGNDLLDANLRDPDFYSKKEDIVEEYRLHMFNGKSIRAGKKVQRPNAPNGQQSHPWIRSFDAGWVIQYDGFKSTKDMRAIAAAAVKALGLDFAAVDLGKRRDGSLLVLEVNRAPGVENNTATTYARAIVNWANGRDQAEE